jgi:cytochrome c-type biogenesis protein CcmH/NrfG
MALAAALTVAVTVPDVYVGVRFGWWWSVLGIVLFVIVCIVFLTFVQVRRTKISS